MYLIPCVLHLKNGELMDFFNSLVGEVGTKSTTTAYSMNLQNILSPIICYEQKNTNIIYTLFFFLPRRPSFTNTLVAQNIIIYYYNYCYTGPDRIRTCNRISSEIGRSALNNMSGADVNSRAR